MNHALGRVVPSTVWIREKRPASNTAAATAAVLLVQAMLLGVGCGPRTTNAFINSPPKFLIDGQTEIVLRLREGDETPAGTLIHTLRGFDADGDPLIFGVREPVGNEILRIESAGKSEAHVYLRRELDREERDEYGLILTLTDGRLGDGNFITQSLLILVEDVNDNEPVFKHYQSTVTVREDSRPGLVVLTVEATDRDEGTYGQVIYRIEEADGDDDAFAVSTSNGKGIIKLVKELDYEEKWLYQLKVLAVDRSNNDRVNTGTAAVVVKVEDVEDRPPEFLAVSPVSRVSEDAPVGTQIMRIRAVDGDRGINNPVRYSLTRGALGAFAIDPVEGIVRTVQKLDRENPSNNNGAYILEITAEENPRETGAGAASAPDPDPDPTPARIAKTEVTIIVTDVNDESPTFRSHFYEGEINENAQANTPVTFLGDFLAEVFDHDQGNNGTFRMLLEGDGGIFEVTPSTGINEASFLIRVRDPARLDYEKMTHLNFSIVAEETVADGPKRARATVTVHVRDMNDNVPVFSEEPYRVSVPENSMKGTTIARIRATDADSGVLGTQGIRYTALSGSVADSLFLDEVTGNVVIESELPLFDREFIDRHYLTVEAADDGGRGNRNTVQLIVDVDDVNDNAPKFFQAKYEARLLENHLEFESPLVVEAHDGDLNGTANSRIRYQILGEDNGSLRFAVDADSGLVRPRRHIDFEELAAEAEEADAKAAVRSITLVVRAWDGGTPSLSSDVAVVVYVSDMNDHAPTFERSGYAVAVPETLAPESTVLRVVATDGDASSPNRDVVYRLQKGAKDKFVIDADTGVISVAPGASLDPDETRPPSTRYTLTVLAMDGGIGVDRLQSSVEVNVTIKDVNNKAPTFVDPGTVKIMENANVGEFVHRVIAVDLDADPILRYRLDGNRSEARNEDGTFIKSADVDVVSFFDLNPVDGTLRVRRGLDREKVERIRLGLVCEDLAAEGTQKAFAVLTVLVEDVNDNSPAFRKPFYRSSITENSKNGVAIVSVVAEDPDKNRTIRYSLEGSKVIAGLVHLDADTGEIVVANRIDHELTPWLNFSVRATDSGQPPRSSFVEVFVQVLDENDNNPHFIGDVANLTVMEDAPPGKEIARMKATDSDSGDFGRITYFLDRISSRGKFRIDPDTGVISVADSLDREKQSFYALIVEAWDNYQFGYATGESRNAFRQIGVTVVDVNDEVPIFETVRGCASVTEFHEVGETIAVVKAHDDDDPLTPNGRMTFEIVGGNEDRLFRIETADETTARISASAPLKGFVGNYTLTLRARDLGTPSNEAETELDICVSDFNDNAPAFVRPLRNATIRVPENATVGTAIIQVHAVDEDFGSNGAVRYGLRKDSLGNSLTFHIDELTGVVSLARPLDRERQKVYNLRVEAHDLGVPTSLSSDLDLTIHVKNVNDCEPQFVNQEIHVNFTEHEKPGAESRLLPDTVDGDEPDETEDPISRPCYFIVAGNERGHFSLDALSHELTVVRTLDREEAARHVLVVKASEDCAHRPEHSDSSPGDVGSVLRVVVTVIDVNDHAPRFTKRVFTGGVTTSADFGTEFMRVLATDEDEGDNGRIRYYQVGKTESTLTEGMDTVQDRPFIVDEVTGSLALNFYPQRGMKGYFRLTVLANDSGGLEDTASVYVYLLRKDQRVRFVLRQHPSELRDRVDRFREELRTATGAVVNVDELNVHENDDGTVDGTKTDLYLHFANENDNSIISVREVLHLVDQNIEKLDALFKEFNVLDTQPSEALQFRGQREKDHVAWLLGALAFLGAMQVLVLVMCCSQRAKYKRAIKAATATAFDPNRPSPERTPRHAPNTNMHSVEGSNPMWMKAYENEWYKEDESSSSRTSRRDSLENSAVTRAGDASGKPLAPGTLHRDDVKEEILIGNKGSPAHITSVRPPSDQPDAHDQNDNSTRTNPYHSLGLSLANTFYACDSMETTEL